MKTKLLKQQTSHRISAQTALIRMRTENIALRVVEFEKEFNITIPDDKAQSIATVADAIAFIEAAEAGK